MRTAVARAAALLALGAASLGAQPPPSPPAPDAQAATAEPSPERAYFSDVVLINQYGEPMRFYSDLLQGRTVVINAFFTTCTGVCPVMAGRLARIQDWLGDRLGKDVFLISLSVDPETDTPERLREYAGRFNAKPGWYFLGGAKANVDWALYRVGQYAEDREAHTNVLVVGNEPAKTWTKAFGLASPSDLIGVVDEILRASESSP